MSTTGSARICAEVLRALVITNIRTYVDPTNPKRVPISADVPDVDALVAYLQSEDGAAAAASDGVALETVVLMVEARP